MVSSQHVAQDQSKILLTGLAGLACFVALLFATHPVMRDLGLVTSVGTGVSLAFTVLTKLGEPT
jgi:predicted RND superfamily exporter protein